MCAFGISKIGGYEIRLASCHADLGDRRFAPFNIATRDDDVDSWRASLLATARPMPLVPPVINAVDKFVLIYNLSSV